MKSIPRIAKTLSLVIAFILLLGALFLPAVCNQFILPQLVENLPVSQVDIRIATISPWRLTGSLGVAHANQPVATIPRFELHYSPASLLRLEFEKLLLDSPYIRLSATENGVSLAGLPQKKDEERETTSLQPIELPVALHHCTVRQGRIHLRNTAATEYDFDLESQINLGFNKGTEKKYELASLSASLTTDGSLRLRAEVDGVFNGDGLLVTTNLNLPFMEDVADFSAMRNKPTVSGEMTAQGRLALTTGLQLGNLDLTVEVNNFQGEYGDVVFAGGHTEKGLQLNLNGNQKLFEFNLSHLALTAPEEVDIDLSGSYTVATSSFETQARLFAGKQAHSFTARTSGTADKNGINAAITLLSPPLQSSDFSLGILEARSRIRVKDDRITGEITGNLDSLNMPGRELVVDNISWRLPLQFPASNRDKGALNIEAIHYKKEKLGKLQADLELGKSDLAYTAQLTGSDSIPGTITCSGSALFTGSASASCTIETTSIDSSSLPGFVTLPDDLNFSLDLTAKAELEYDKTGPAAHVAVHVKNGAITSGETTLTGITTDLTFPALPSLRSGTGQLLALDDIQSGKIHLTKGRIFYTIEDENTIFLERVLFNWCGGKIETAGLRLTSKMKEVGTTFYCDRLSFSELLHQFGIEDTEGQGSLNGRLPVAFGAGGLTFDDGFLFSTPGNSGIVHFGNTEQLRQGIGDTSQSATLDYSIQSLENFAYNWTKLSFNSEGEELLLAMQLDGKPASPLPFGYKNGQIVATKKGSGLQHPLRLDMNFRLPLQQLFKYGKNIQSLMENM